MPTRQAVKNVPPRGRSLLHHPREKRRAGRVSSFRSSSWSASTKNRTAPFDISSYLNPVNRSAAAFIKVTAIESAISTCVDSRYPLRAVLTVSRAVHHKDGAVHVAADDLKIVLVADRLQPGPLVHPHIMIVPSRTGPKIGQLDLTTTLARHQLSTWALRATHI
jgi:hypothetical protein